MLNILLTIFITATLDSTEMSLGNQTKLHLEATPVQNEIVEFPQYGKELIGGIEIIEQSKIDTIKQKDGTKTLRQNLTLTSFRDSLFYIPPQAFVVDGDTLYTQSLALNVIQPFDLQTAQKDTTQAEITDIKPVMSVPIWWWGYLRWVLLGLGIALVLALLIWGIIKLVIFLRKRKRIKNLTEEERILLRPAEEVALEKLDKIKEEKIWQHGREKEYHSDLTAVVREYIARRYDVRSQEKTSNETLQQLKPILKEQRELFDSLSKMLKLADLVKFAKWKATPDENETSLRSAYNFVHSTTPQPESTTENTTENP